LIATLSGSTLVHVRVKDARIQNRSAPNSAADGFLDKLFQVLENPMAPSPIAN